MMNNPDVQKGVADAMRDPAIRQEVAETLDHANDEIARARAEADGTD